ncbi:hypothetical protein H9P43_003883 [Blastocladiella emersonii ATCC 22665]|nr:hypothetical protein H9P43_003879 [Blastocladiella emersonii ATCC 22665]KAI9182967.1 hypothetical protein H9P43_003883 [Blastocladiella emersonii ATCC 22665]
MDLADELTHFALSPRGAAVITTALASVFALLVAAPAAPFETASMLTLAEYRPTCEDKEEDEVSSEKTHPVMTTAGGYWLTLRTVYSRLGYRRGLNRALPGFAADVATSLAAELIPVTETIAPFLGIAADTAAELELELNTVAGAALALTTRSVQGAIHTFAFAPLVVANVRRIVAVQPKGLFATARDHIRADRPYSRAHGAIALPLLARFVLPTATNIVHACLRPLVLSADRPVDAWQLARLFGLTLAVESASCLIDLPLQMAVVRLSLDPAAESVVRTRKIEYPEDAAACLEVVVREEGGSVRDALWQRLMRTVYRTLAVEVATSVVLAAIEVVSFE